MAIAYISALSTQYVKSTVGSTVAGMAINPVTDTLQVAFTTPGVAPVTGDWKAGSWETDSTMTPPAYIARAFVGPGAGAVIALSAASWDMWLRIFDSPETIVIRAGELKVY